MPSEARLKKTGRFWCVLLNIKSVAERSEAGKNERFWRAFLLQNIKSFGEQSEAEKMRGFAARFCFEI